jgi:hypothetical protein
MTLLLSFKSNQEIIAKTLCIEKEVLNNSCNGKCQLAKQLKKIATNENEDSSNIIDTEKLELLYTLPLFFDINLNLLSFVQKKSILFPYRKTKSFSQLIFHPPIF